MRFRVLRSSALSSAWLHRIAPNPYLSTGTAKCAAMGVTTTNLGLSYLPYPARVLFRHFLSLPWTCKNVATLQNTHTEVFTPIFSRTWSEFPQTIGEFTIFYLYRVFYYPQTLSNPKENTYGRCWNVSTMTRNPLHIIGIPLCISWGCTCIGDGITLSTSNT